MIDQEKALELAKEHFRVLEEQEGARIELEDFEQGWVVRYNLPPEWDKVGLGPTIVDYDGGLHQYGSSYSSQRAIEEYLAKQSS